MNRRERLLFWVADQVEQLALWLNSVAWRYRARSYPKSSAPALTLADYVAQDIAIVDAAAEMLASPNFFYQDTQK